MIVLDTHVWVWWVDDHPRLHRQVRGQLDSEDDIRVSAISLLEIATLTALNRLVLRPSAELGLEIAQSVANVQVEPLTAPLCLESIRLPGEFHRNPADRLIVALARQNNAPLFTADAKLLNYPHVRCVNAEA